jgi:hypothetical protein
MAQHAIPTDSASTHPVRLIWQRSDDGDVGPAVTLTDTASRAAVFDYYGVGSAPALADAVLTPSQRRQRETVRLGVVIPSDDKVTYYTEIDLLSMVEGIDKTLATALIEWYDDIPTLCEERRRQGEVLLGDCLHDARVEDRPWTDDLAAFIDGLGHRESFERRLKAAGVWVEPDSVAAEGM